MKKKTIWGNHLKLDDKKKESAKANIRFCAARDVASVPMADERLVVWDLWTNYAHCQMLAKQKIINNQEWQKLKQGFYEIFKLHSAGKFPLDPELEDVHINIEMYITNKKSIQAGKKIHTARSRNDQIATTIRLYLRHHCLSFLEELAELIASILKKSSQELETCMIGFTHYQPAMPTTFAHWLTHWSQGLIRSFSLFLEKIKAMNRSPLGSTAGFGSAWRIDREYTAKLLGFDSVQENTLDCITSRGEWESRLAGDIAILMNQFCIISQDLILLSHPYFGMLKLADSFVTGSSIMPQKKNPDFAEVIRSKTSYSHGVLQSLLGISKGTMSGYNRDSQQSKYLVMDLFAEIESIPKILSGVIETSQAKKKNMAQKSKENFANAADLADYLAADYGLAFRDSYNLVALAVKHSKEAGKIEMFGLKKAASELKISIAEKKLASLLQNDSPLELLKKKKHIGGPAPESVKKMIQNQKKELSLLTQNLKTIKKKTGQAYQKCFPK